MAYTKATDFAAKDALLTGNPAKIVKGTEIDAEFNAIAAADALNIKLDAAGTDNIAIGSGALDSAAAGATDNIAIGKNAATALTTSYRNVVIGNGAATAAIDTLTDSVVIGYGALALNKAGSSVVIGRDAAAAAHGGSGGASYAVVIGYEAAKVATGVSGVLIGYRAGDAITNASENVCIGPNAGALMTDGLRNIAIGASTRAGTTGDYNISLGYIAGSSIGTGSYNVTIGSSANLNGGGDNNICVGYQAEPSSSVVSNEITLGNSSIATLRCQVTSITSLSDARDKTDIAPLTTGLSIVMALNPVRFTWNMRDGGKVGVKDTGFIAQDLQTVDDEWLRLVYAENPEKLEASYGRLIPVLVKAIQELKAELDDLRLKM